MFYAINDYVGVMKDVESFSAKIAEVLKSEGKVNVIPLAETREELFQKIIDKGFEIYRVAMAIVYVATDNQDGTTIDYDDSVYFQLCEAIQGFLEDIKTLATATEPGREKNYLQPFAEIDRQRGESQQEVRS